MSATASSRWAQNGHESSAIYRKPSVIHGSPRACIPCRAMCSATRRSASASTFAKGLGEKSRKCRRKDGNGKRRKPRLLLELRGLTGGLQLLLLRGNLCVDVGV